MALKQKTLHNIVIVLLILIVIITIAVLLYLGYDYYATSLEERYFNPNHNLFKASGIVGHGLGIIGTLLIVFGVFSYMIRKRFRRFSRVGVLKYWLEFHIFLCTLGPILILFHTTFKFGGIVAVSFWSMVAVVLSGVIGRFIYIQIPRTIQGRELSLLELEDIQLEMNKQLRSTILLDESIYETLESKIVRNKQKRYALIKLKHELKAQKLSKVKAKEVLSSFNAHISMKNRISRLVTMQNLFKYWHVAHLPFALVMLIIMIIHVVVALTFGYKWIF